jgi:hypothetical protein
MNMCHGSDGTLHCSKRECWCQVIVPGLYQSLHYAPVRFKILTEVSVKIQVFRDVMLCQLVST